ncbi:LysR family transcriptional regulator [Pseudomonas viridiflava]
MDALDFEMIGFDLNLLITLAVVYREKSVSQAAGHLRVSQPAVSNALRKLRGLFNDELFIRSNGEFLITAKCEQFMSQVEPAIISIQAALRESLKQRG